MNRPKWSTGQKLRNAVPRAQRDSYQDQLLVRLALLDLPLLKIQVEELLHIREHGSITQLPNSTQGQVVIRFPSFLTHFDILPYGIEVPQAQQHIPCYPFSFFSATIWFSPFSYICICLLSCFCIDFSLLKLLALYREFQSSSYHLLC